MFGRHADRCGIERSRRSQAGLNRCEGWNAEFLRSFGSDGSVAVDYSGQLDGFARLLELAIDAKVVAPEGSRANDRHAQRLRGRH